MQYRTDNQPHECFTETWNVSSNAFCHKIDILRLNTAIKSDCGGELIGKVLWTSTLNVHFDRQYDNGIGH